MKTRFTSILIAAGAALLLVGFDSPARADISFVDMFRTNLYFQSGDGAAGTAYGLSYLYLDLHASAANEFSTVQTSYPGPGSPVALTQDPMDATVYSYTSPDFTSQASMDAAYPMGTYSFTANSSSEAFSTMVDYESDAYSSTVPYLTGTTFSDAQGLNAAAPFTFNLSPFTPDASSTEAFIFFNIFDVDNNVVFSANFLDPSTTSVVLPGGTLNPNEAYIFDVDFSDRVLVPSPGAEFAGQLGFDVRTEGVFYTAPAVPEPGSSDVLLGLGTIALLTQSARLKLRARKQSAVIDFSALEGQRPNEQRTRFRSTL